jgi:heterodisulfide reductase subunit A2
MAIQEKSKIGAVLVVGGGVAGLQATMDLASSGYKVYLADRAPTLGGLMPQIDKTFPTNDCAMCFIAPKDEDRSGCLRGGVGPWRHCNVQVFPDAEVKSLDGEAGNFRALLATRPRFIDPATCTACGKCAEVCPERAVNEFNRGLDKRPAAYLAFPQAVPRLYAIDQDACTNCGMCAEVCPVNAVNFADQPRERELAVGAVVLAVGNDVFNPVNLPQYLYGRHLNVVSSIDYERIYSGTGPYGGHIVRPSDETEPKKIAWLQCIGSRDLHTHSYCSSVCCMYAIKEAMIAKDYLPGVDTAIFYMDIRVCGKDYEQYYTRARDEYGVRFVCYRVPEIKPADNGDLNITYFDAEGKKQTEIFNMVVLSAGFEVSDQARDLAVRLGIVLDRHNYPRTDPFVPVAASRPGVYVCGTFQAPKDIPESITEASAAAACCQSWLGGARQVETESGARAGVSAAGEPKLGMVFCGWGPDIAELVDLDQVKKAAAALPEVSAALEHPLNCAAEDLKRLARETAARGVNRVVLVAAGAPWIQEPKLRQAFIHAGFNKYLVEIVNIRAEAAWVHTGDRAGATAKAKELVKAAAARLATLKPLAEQALPVEQKALVIGGGVAGLNAALGLAKQGFDAYLIDKAKELGGLGRQLHRTIEGDSVPDYLEGLIREVTANPRIEVLTETAVVRHLGTRGNFRTTVATGSEGAERTLHHGAVIVATGAIEYRPTEYMYGADDRVMTQLDLEVRLAAEPQLAASWQRVVMMQCVGSRNEQNPTCSRICCQTAVKHALQLKQTAPDLDVVIFHRDMRLYGMLEDHYLAARDQKILFERFDPARPPRVQDENGGLHIVFWDNILKREIQWPVDAVVLSAATQAADTADLAHVLNLPRNEQGFFQENHPKMRPLDFATEGYYLCGTAHSPKLVKEAVTQGLGAAARAGAFLAAATQLISPVVAEVTTGRCVGCLACVRTCPYHVPQMEKGRSSIQAALCLGCGVCAGVCPAGAIKFAHYTDEQLQAQMSA